DGHEHGQNSDSRSQNAASSPFPALSVGARHCGGDPPAGSVAVLHSRDRLSRPASLWKASTEVILAAIGETLSSRGNTVSYPGAARTSGAWDRVQARKEDQMGSTSRRRRIGPFFLVLAAALSVMAVALRQPVVAGQSADWSMSPTSDFPLAGGDYANQRYSTLDQINTTNVNKLGGAWSVHLEEGGAVGNLDGTPTVVNGVMYVSTPRLNVLAIDASNGAIKWRYRPGPETRTGANKGGVAGDGKVFVGRRDNLLVALDQQTGQVVWQKQLTDHPAAYTSAAPVYYNGRVYIGTAGGDNGARGKVGAFDAKTGQEVWT